MAGERGVGIGNLGRVQQPTRKPVAPQTQKTDSNKESIWNQAKKDLLKAPDLKNDPLKLESPPDHISSQWDNDPHYQEQLQVMREGLETGEIKPPKPEE